MKTQNKPQPFISNAQKYKAELVELRNIHVDIIRSHEQELHSLKFKYKKQSQRLGGYVQSNKNYKKKNKLQVLEICDLGITINSIKERCKCQQTEISCLKIDVEAAETNYELEYRKNKDLASQLKEIRSKWWFWLFNW